VKRETVLVTGASGFMGRRMVAALRGQGYHVRAGVRDLRVARQLATEGITDPVHLDLRDSSSVHPALEGVSAVYHLAALVGNQASSKELNDVNVAGTRRLWSAAADAGVRRMLYCSSAAVYGLRAGRNAPITEDVVPAPFEPYGCSKLNGEREAFRLAQRSNVATVAIRPVAMFGPGERTGISTILRQMAMSRIILPGRSDAWSFSFIHVDDVVRAAIHLMTHAGTSGQVYNVAVEPCVSFDEAFTIYRRVLARIGRCMYRERVVASVSAVLQRLSRVLPRLPESMFRRWSYGIWRPGWDLTYSAAKLRATSFTYAWDKFEDILLDCLTDGRHEG
jgi:UDP-glucose 4-epimerase